MPIDTGSRPRIDPIKSPPHISSKNLCCNTDRNMSTLIAHVDQIRTHVISVIMNIGQDVEEDWPLFIMNNKGEENMINLAPGPMVFYESARLMLCPLFSICGCGLLSFVIPIYDFFLRLVHGRQRPLRGSFYDNIFIHYQPKGLWYTSNIQPDDPVSKISAEAVRWSQRNIEAEMEMGFLGNLFFQGSILRF